MKRRWKIIATVIVLLVGLALLNAFAANRETEAARVTVEGGQILELPGGALQALDVPASGPAAEEGAPIVLVHGYTASINWWQELIPLLSERHRIVAIDLLGHGGSAKPSSGYTIPNQADLIAQVLNQLGVEGALVVGHSLGGAVVTRVAERASELVDRLVIVGMAPAVEGYGDLDFSSKVSRLPVIGPAIKRLAPDSLVRRGLAQGFAPGFPVPDFAVEDVRRMTYTAYHDWPGANEAYTAEKSLDQRVKETFVPLLAVFGSEDQIFDARTSLSTYAAVPGTQTELMDGVGHSPMLEAPEELAQILEDFAPPRQAPEAEEAVPDSEPARSRTEKPKAAKRQARSEQPSARQRQKKQAERRGGQRSPKRSGQRG